MTENRTLREKISALTQNKKVEMLAGTAIGVLIILLAVIISVLLFGSYGWGLFVLTPLVVGVSTGYFINRRECLSVKTTFAYVLYSAALGCLGLIVFALEGLICLLMASPLGALAACGGGLFGRYLARIGKGGTGPVYCLILLPMIFALESAYPQTEILQTQESIIISAPTSEVWSAIISHEPIREPATLVGRLGLSYPRYAELSGHAKGAIRTGYFSTGETLERIIAWDENRTLGLEVLRQPPSMNEISPYGHINTPHIEGYFQTGETRFELTALNNSSTKLTIKSVHSLRIEPLFYWKPIAKWAIQGNVQRVLRDYKAKAEWQP